MIIAKDIAPQAALNEHLQNALSKFQHAIEGRILEELNKKGFIFSKPKELHAFIDQRITVATVEDHPFLNLVYLDFVDFDNLGTFLFAYNTEVKQQFVDGVLKLSIG